MSIPEEPISHNIPLRENSEGKRSVAAMDIEEAGSGSVANNKAVGSGVQSRLNQFRDFVSNTCCSCVGKMPAILLVITICMTVALLLALIPAIFVLTNAVSSETQPLVSKFDEVNAQRHLTKILPDNETEEAELLPAMVHGIPVTALYPPNISMCFGMGFACLNEPSIVISTAKRCDGINDCPDGSDERDCQSCQTWASCNLQGEDKLCLHGSHLCDRIRHCVDHFDETNYCKSECDEDQHRCKRSNGMDICLPKDAICDGNNDCADGSDEWECSVCAPGAKLCADNNVCIAARNVCDGIPDCDDGSDEMECDCRSCSGTHLALCGDGTCIQEDRICDGVPDCLDGSDEEKCPGFCPIEQEKVEEVEGSGQFCCSFDLTCHSSTVRCDGVVQCSDGEDEINCSCTECLGRHQDVYMCGDGTRCLRREDVCTPYSTCPNATTADKAYCAVQSLRNLQI